MALVAQRERFRCNATSWPRLVEAWALVEDGSLLLVVFTASDILFHALCRPLQWKTCFVIVNMYVYIYIYI